MNPVEVYKFGGASVKDAEAIRNVAKILRNTEQRPLAVVISAMGKTTNALEAIIQAHIHQPEEVPSLVDKLKTYHEAIVREILGEQAGECLNDLHDLWVELNWILEEEPRADFNYHYDQIIVFGELASTKIVSAYLKAQGVQHEWMDARGLIKTDNAFREARILWDQTQMAINSLLKKSLEKVGMVVTQGFIGSTIYNESTSLGREGSDYTAAILAYALDARSVTIWKDVPGIMTGDPKRFSSVAKLDELSFEEAIEMTYYGAKVIHPKTIKPLQNKNIPLYVRPFDRPEEAGTKISTTELKLPQPIVVVEPNQSLIKISTRDFSFVAEEHLQEIFTQIAGLRIKVNSMQNTALSFLVCVTRDEQKMKILKESLGQRYELNFLDNLELFSVRHAENDFLAELKKGKTILFEEQVGDTVQFIVKSEK